MFCLYKLTFPNGKLYFGITSDFKKRMRSHKHKENELKVSPLHNAIKKYKWINVDVVILYDNLLADEAYEMEQKLIKENNTTNIDFGYNLDIGGKTRIGSKNRKPAYNKGKHLTKEHISNIILSKQGKSYSEISSKNATKYPVIATNIVSGIKDVYRNVSVFCEHSGCIPSSVYNHIRRNSKLLNKTWKVNYYEQR